MKHMSDRTLFRHRGLLGVVMVLAQAPMLHAQTAAAPAPVATTQVHVDAGKKIGTIKAPVSYTHLTLPTIYSV